MLATASGQLHCKGLPLPEGPCKENQDWNTHGQVCTDALSPLGLEETPQKLFEARLREGRGDVVKAWCEYVQWTGEHRPLEELSVLRRACYALAGDPKHREDIRHLRLWVRHAAAISEAEKVFDFLEAEGIGQGHALLYEAWASHWERQRNFAEAQRQYQLGLQRDAEPQERLQKRYEEFQRRMCKRAARKGSKPAVGESKVQGATSPQLNTSTASTLGATETFAVHEDTALQVCEDEPELPVHDQVFIPIPARLVEPELPATQTLLKNTEEAPRVLARIGGAGEWKVTGELTSGLRSLLETASHPRRSSCEMFEDPTYTAELAQREILALFATDEPGSRSSTCRSRSSNAFEIFEETDFVGH